MTNPHIDDHANQVNRDKLSAAESFLSFLGSDQDDFGRRAFLIGPAQQRKECSLDDIAQCDVVRIRCGTNKLVIEVHGQSWQGRRELAANMNLKPARIVRTAEGDHYQIIFNIAGPVESHDYASCGYELRRALSGEDTDTLYVAGTRNGNFQVDIVHSDDNAPAYTAAQIIEAVGDPDGQALQPPKIEGRELSPLDTINPNASPRNITEALNRWVWVTSIKRWVNRLDPTMKWDMVQFDSEYNKFTPEVASISKFLFKQQRRMRRFKAIQYLPGRPEFYGEIYNSWRPGPIKPVKPHNDETRNAVRAFVAHLDCLFGKDTEERKQATNWMAWVLQHPSEKPHQALLIVGEETGTGKSIIARVLEQLVGVDNTQRPKNSSVGGDFNGWLELCRLAIIEEMMQFKRRESANALRDVITEPTVEVNIKGIPAFKIPNFTAMMGISNHFDAVPIDGRDRRWLVVGIPDAVKAKAPDEYTALVKAIGIDEKPALPAERKAARLGAIYWALLNKDLKGWEPVGHAVMTTAKRAMIEQSKTTLEKWLDDERENDPLNRELVNIREDIVPRIMHHPHIARDAMTVRKIESTVATYLREKLHGVNLSNVRIGNRVIKLWAINAAGRAAKADQDWRLKNDPAAIYKDSAATADTMADFAPGLDD